jgi:NitT/TauT family transport system substrate-binding protein
MRWSKPLLVAITAVALGSGTFTARAAEPVKIRVAWAVPVSNYASILYEKKDLLKHQGKSYNLELVRFQGTPPMITALATNEVDIANLAFSSFALAIQNAGLDDLRVISDEFQDGVGDWYSQEYRVLKDSPIKTVADLKGKVIATVGAGSGVDIAMRAMLRKHGLDEKKDVTWVEAGFPNMKAMLASKKVDLIPSVLPFGLDPELLEMSRTLFPQKEAIGRSQMILWAARAGFLQKNRAAMVDFMEDTLRITRWYLDPKNHKEAMEIAGRVTKQPPERFDWLFTKRDAYHDPNMLPDLAALQRNVDMTRDLGFVKSTLDVKSKADLSIVEEAAKRLK